MHNALFVPNLGVNLISASHIIIKGFYAVHDYRDYAVMNNSDNKLMFKAERLDNERLWTAIWASNDLHDSIEHAYPASHQETVRVHNEESVLVDNPDFDTSRLYQMGTAKRKIFEEYNK